MGCSDRSVTQLLKDACGGCREALDELMPLVYEDLHARAVACMKGERRDHTLQPTALVNEAYVRLVDESQVTWHDRGHFLAIAAKTMRRILARHARDRRALKRGGNRDRVPLGDDLAVPGNETADYLDLDEALDQLESSNARMAKVVEIRFFGGATIEETAEILKLDPRTVKRDWKTARLFLLDRLSEGGRFDDGRSNEAST